MLIPCIVCFAIVSLWQWHHYACVGVCILSFAVMHFVIVTVYRSVWVHVFCVLPLYTCDSDVSGPAQWCMSVSSVLPKAVNLWPSTQRRTSLYLFLFSVMHFYDPHYYGMWVCHLSFLIVHLLQWRDIVQRCLSLCLLYIIFYHGVLVATECRVFYECVFCVFCNGVFVVFAMVDWAKHVPSFLHL